MNEIEVQNKSSGSFESSDANHGIHVSCGRTSSSEISTQSHGKLYVTSVQEGAETRHCNVSISLMQKNDDIAGISEVREENKHIYTYQRRKRLKKTELSDLPQTGSLPSLPKTIRSVSSNHPVENKLSEEGSDSSLALGETSSNNDDKPLIGKLNGNASENRDDDMIALTLTEHRTENRDSDPTLKNKSSCDADMLAINPVDELHDEANKTVRNIELHVEFEEQNIGNFPRTSSSDALGGDTSLHHEEPSDDKQLDGLKGVASQVVNESINVAANRAFAGCTGKKLLVLDVNGLLVDISSYVPYDYDPDDIIHKKAVFKRPYCDDFLKFCFERFNVGVWTSRTKWNIEPILDFLLGSDKCKLLFCWDQSHCTNTGFYTVEKRHKPLLLKKLKKLWDKCEPDLPWERGLYNKSNTLLLDDTPYKALSNPRYTAIFPYTYHFRDVNNNSLGPGGDLRVYLEGLAMAENVQEYVKENPFGQRPITEKNLSWGFYRKVIEASSTPPRDNDEDDDSRDK